MREIALVQAALVLHQDLFNPDGHPNPLRGGCYIGSEALYHMTGGKERWVVCRAQVFEDDLERIDHRPTGVTHWYLRDRNNGAKLDVTESQFGEREHLESETKTGFLTAGLSKRAAVILKTARRLAALEAASV